MNFTFGLQDIVGMFFLGLVLSLAIFIGICSVVDRLRKFLKDKK